MKNALDQIARITEALNKVNHFANLNGGLAELLVMLDRLVSDHTAFKTFSYLVHAQGNYRPSIPKAPNNIVELISKNYRLPSGRTISIQQYYAELDLLAICYDMAQEAKGDSRRAFR